MAAVLFVKNCLKTVTCGLQQRSIQVPRTKTLYTSCPNLAPTGLWMRLLSVINQVYPHRIEEVGPDRACAEWLVKNGGAVRWVGNPHQTETDYNLLPQNVTLKIEEIICDEAVVLSNGFGYLGGLKHVKRFTLHNCKFASDRMVSSLFYLRDSLEHLQISSCRHVTQDGLNSLEDLRKLQYLLLFDLESIRDKAKCIEQLKERLPPDCLIEFPDTPVPGTNRKLKSGS
ncbi:ATP synthase subunit s, mitochondrial-like [Ylistrum balloti]|uniref:ATP synthase subunit s, mitochondrial-like n=1 Tax=Ylistrum balloti TaxID=509963 RepID=UPI002905DE38|nr:ATP synthase subunit s, mitochondrial-like [Ylistrum balloti]